MTRLSSTCFTVVSINKRKTGDLAQIIKGVEKFSPDVLCIQEIQKSSSIRPLKIIIFIDDHELRNAKKPSNCDASLIAITGQGGMINHSQPPVKNPRTWMQTDKIREPTRSHKTSWTGTDPTNPATLKRHSIQVDEIRGSAKNPRKTPFDMHRPHIKNYTNSYNRTTESNIKIKTYQMNTKKNPKKKENSP
jgi:hypothetical protein